MAKKPKPDRERKVQGKWHLGHKIEVLRENVFVGDKPLKDLKEEELAIIWEKKIGTSNFREAVRREVVHRVAGYFKMGYEKMEEGFKPKAVAGSIHSEKQKAKLDPEVQKAIEEAMKKREGIQS